MNNALKIAVVLAFAAACDHLDTFPLQPDAGIVQVPPHDGGMIGPEVRFKPVDVLFVVDNSISMGDEQENLAQNFASFAAQIIGFVNYRIAVITTDASNSPSEQQGFVMSGFSASPPYQLRSLDNTDCSSANIMHGCFRGDGAVVASNMDLADQITAFEDNVRVGTCGSGEERAFAALLLALEEMQPGGCNEGFLRPDANLVIIFVSDEDDSSAQTIVEYADAIGTFKPWSQVRVGAIVGAIGGQASECSISAGASCGGICNSPPPMGSHMQCQSQNTCPAGEFCSFGDYHCENIDLQYWAFCNSCSYYNTPDCCSALAGARYLELGLEMEDRITAVRSDIPDRDCAGLGTRVACLVDTICQNSFGDTMARLAQELCLDAEQQ